MNEKGFTLVELIALIGLLIIIILVTFPNFTNQIEWSKKNSYNNFISDLCLASESYINHSPNLDGLDNFNQAGDTITISVGELIDNGYIKSNIKNPKTDEKVSATEQVLVTIKDDLTYECELSE